MKEHTCNNCKWCPAGIGFAASSISEAVALNVLFCAHCVLVTYALECRGKKAKPLMLELSSCRHLDIIILTPATQAVKNYGFPSFLLRKAMKAIEGCACLGVRGEAFFMYFFASG